MLREEPQRAERAREVGRELSARLSAAGLDASVPDAAVVSVRVAAPETALAWAAACREQGVLVGCFRPPSVPDRWSRLRLTARADLTPDQIEHAVQVLVRAEPSR